MDKSDPSLHLIVPPFTVRLAQYAPDVPIPPTLFLTPLPFLSVTRSEGETTVLYGHNDPSYKLEGLPEPREVDGPYSVLRVNGPLVLSTLCNDKTDISAHGDTERVDQAFARCECCGVCSVDVVSRSACCKIGR